MELWIERVSEPRRLILSWRAPEDFLPDRHRWAVGELNADATGVVFRYYNDAEFDALNNGRGIDALKTAGFLGYPAFRYLPGATFSERVLEAFARRLPPRSRSDFPKYLEHFRLQGGSHVSTMALLAVTEAKLPSDGFALVDPLDPETTECDLVLEVAGHRHYLDGAPKLEVGMPVYLVSEPANPHDPNAVRVEAAGAKIGHISRFQAPVVGDWLASRQIDAWLMRLNGSEASPRAFIFLRVRPRRQQTAA